MELRKGKEKKNRKRETEKIRTKNTLRDCQHTTTNNFGHV